MKNHTHSLQNKKFIACCLHFVFVLVALTGISLMYLNNNFGKGIIWVQNEGYEDTEEFYDQLQGDIKEIFEYVRYRDVFETNGKIDFSKPMLELTFGPGDERSYTLDDIIRYTKSRGYFLNDTYAVSGVPTAPTEEDKEEAFVDWKAYEPSDPDVADILDTATLEELSLEVLGILGNYYSICNNLMSGSSNLYFQIVYQDPEHHLRKMYSNASASSVAQLKSLGRYIKLSGDSVIIDTNLDSKNISVTSYLTSYNPYQNNSYYMVLALDTSYPHIDTYSKAAMSYQRYRSHYVAGLALMVIGCIVSLVTLFYMMMISGHKDDRDSTIALFSFDKTTTETWLLVVTVSTFAGLFLCKSIVNRIIHLVLSRDAWSYTEQLAYMVVIYFCLLIGTFGLLRRYKAGTLWSNSIIHRILKGISIIFIKQDFSFRMAFYFCSYLLVSAILAGLAMFCYLNWRWDPLLMKILLVFSVLIWLGINLWIFSILYRNTMQRDKINAAIKQLSDGDTSYQVDLSKFTGREEEVAVNLNHISEGLETALQEKVKSERLKADLITNVSHDIKTPLTSIINYVDLIKRQNIQDEKVLGYLEVLEQKSQRLKTLTEDLVEASKASSGNLKLEINDIDLVEMIYQTNGEFEDKFAFRHLDLVSQLPDESYVIEADGRRLWRVLENLYNNAFKYAMEHSRVYVDVTYHEETGLVTFTIKNISSNPLNISPDELTERFVRGDVARTTEGSGLGLSIAKSLTDLQNGYFDLVIDGDLFKAQVSFPLKKETGKSEVQDGTEVSPEQTN